MILLSFSSAAKYIISMLLAVLGIISYEDIQVPDRPVEVPHQAFVLQERPLDPITHKPVGRETLSNFLPAEEHVPAFIPARFDHESSLQPTYPLPESIKCLTNAQFFKEAADFGQVIIVVRDLESEFKETTFTVQSDGI